MVKMKNTRAIFFKNVQDKLGKLNFASANQLCGEVKIQVESLNSKYLHQTGYAADSLSSLLLANESADIIPINTIGDGNCLPREACLFVDDLDHNQENHL